MTWCAALLWGHLSNVDAVATPDPDAPGLSCAPGDCDDTPGAGGLVNPGADEADNEVDDDCDGQTDEGFDVGGACVVGTGACAVNGVLICDYGQYATTCQGTPALPSDEIGGDGIDNDCDGYVDETCALKVEGWIFGDGFVLGADNGEHILSTLNSGVRFVGESTDGELILRFGLPNPQQGTAPE